VNELGRKAAGFWPWLAAILTGVLCTACFAPFNQSWLCWIALTPLIVAIWFSGKDSKRRWLRDLLLGYVAGIVFFTATFSWLGQLGTLFENFWLHGLSLLLSLYLAMHFAFWSWFVGLVRPRHKTPAPAASKWEGMLEQAGKPPTAASASPWLRSTNNLWLAFALASAWIAHEWVRGWLFGGFGWNGLGVALHGNWPLIQIAEFTGVTGLSFLIAFTNVIAVTTPLRLFLEARTHRMRPHWDLNFTMLAVIGLFVLGWQVAQSPRLSKPLRVAAVQTNIPQEQKFEPTEQILDTCDQLSTLAVQREPKPELIVWPEGSIPGTFGRDTWVLELPQAVAQRSGADLLLGVDDEENDRAYNAALLISPSGKSQLYRKVHLVPFGEYIPLRHPFPLFAAVASKWVPGDFASGTEYTVFNLTNGDVHVAPLICFEDTIGELTRQFVLKGANLLVNVTNDGWFRHSAGSEQHLANSIFRCVENRRPMVRAANTGVTCFVNEFGRVTKSLHDEKGSTFVRDVLNSEVNVPQDPQLTFYTRHGELLAKFCAAATLLVIVTSFVRRKWL
jgi:apolipoprotein N-acyltransferase